MWFLRPLRGLDLLSSPAFPRLAPGATIWRPLRGLRGWSWDSHRDTSRRFAGLNSRLDESMRFQGQHLCNRFW